MKASPPKRRKQQSKPLVTAKELAAFQKVASRPDHPGEKYALDCLAGKIPCGRYAQLAMKRHFLDLIKSKQSSYLYRFDRERAEHALQFFKFMVHSRGEWAGSPLVLDPWQQFLLWVSFGWVFKKNGLRRFRVVYVEVPRKNGKTTMASGVAAYLADADGEPGAEIYCVGADESQALRCFKEICFSIRKSAELSQRFKVFADSITIEETNSIIQPIAHNPDAVHSKNPSGAIIDETHAHKNDEVFDAMDTGRGSRREPMLFCISTAGSSMEGIGWELSARAKSCLDAVGSGDDPDEQFMAMVYCADQGDAWDDELTWRKANPGYGVSIKPEYFEEQKASCKRNPRKRRRFEQLHLNIWSQQYQKWLDITLWDKCAGAVPLKKLAARQVLAYAAGDLSARKDLCSVVLTFRWKKHWYVKAWHWITREALEIERPSRTQLNRWAEEGELQVEESRVIDQGNVFKRFRWIARKFNLAGVALDPWNAAWMMKRLDSAGVTVVEYPQRLPYFAPVCRLLEETLAEGNMSHGGSKLLRWQANHVAVKTDDNGNARPTRKGSADKIDGIIGMLMAMGLWQKLNGEDDEEGGYTPQSSAIV